MNAYAPLAGVKVLDLGILVPAALTSGRLAALGADVVKVEQPPRGDRIRLIPPYGDDGQSPQHMAQNWGKRSIGVDVKSDEGRELILALIAAADVVVENQLAGFWARVGIDFAALRTQRPELIVCSVTGFGQDGQLVPTARPRPEHRRAGRRAHRRLEGRPTAPRRGLHQLGQRARHAVRRHGGVRGAGVGPLRRPRRMDRRVVLGRVGRVAPHRTGDEHTDERAVLAAQYTVAGAVHDVSGQRRPPGPAWDARTQVLAPVLRRNRKGGPDQVPRWCRNRLRRRRHAATRGTGDRVREGHVRRVAATLHRLGRPWRPRVRRSRAHGDRALRRPQDHRGSARRVAAGHDRGPMVGQRWPRRQWTGPAA